ncbi:LpqB family beta-propeller domain-containing protein [Actinokineospora sp. 24-640]
MTRLLTALLAVAFLAGCATIPADTQPKVVLDNPGEAPIRGPKPDTDPFTLVQEFLNNAGNVRAAATYLTEDARKNWPAGDRPVIVENNPTYRPDLGTDRPPPDAGQNNRIAITLSTDVVGRLHTDGTFFPEVQERSDRLILQRQDDGQWRISQPPSDLLLTEANFVAAYRRVNLQFFDPEQRVLVPDPRWVEDQPREGLEGRVMDLLLNGPSAGLRGAVVSPLQDVKLLTNVVRDDDGAILINLANVTDKSPEDRDRMVAQIVNSLSSVTLSVLRLLDNGSALVPERQDWRSGDVGSYDVLATPKSDLVGLAVDNRRVISLRDGKPVEGPVGAGAYDLVSAAQSLDGGHLAAVERTPGAVRLRVGPINEDLPVVKLPTTATSLTRPTWTPGNSIEEPGGEVWTVVDGTLVVRAVRVAGGGWRVLPVDAAELTRDNGRITQLRLSRDGVRLAAVVGGQVQVAVIVRGEEDSVTIRAPRTLQLGTVRSVASVDWSERTVLVVATYLPAMPVVAIPVDGFNVIPYLATILTVPVTAVTAAPSRPVIVTDAAGMWFTGEPGKVWLSQPFGSANALPFYPG